MRHVNDEGKGVHIADEPSIFLVGTIGFKIFKDF